MLVNVYNMTMKEGTDGRTQPASMVSEKEIYSFGTTESLKLHAAFVCNIEAGRS